MAQGLGKRGRRRRWLWRHIAYAARYGRADPVALIGRPFTVGELCEYVEAVGDLLKEEDAVSRTAHD